MQPYSTSREMAQVARRMPGEHPVCSRIFPDAYSINKKTSSRMCLLGSIGDGSNGVCARARAFMINSARCALSFVHLPRSSQQEDKADGKKGTTNKTITFKFILCVVLRTICAPCCLLATRELCASLPRSVN